jgi:hypothetical protein
MESATLTVRVKAVFRRNLRAALAKPVIINWINQCKNNKNNSMTK